MATYYNPPNERALDELFVFCSVDEHGLRGIVASILPGAVVIGSTGVGLSEAKRDTPRILRSTYPKA